MEEQPLSTIGVRGADTTPPSQLTAATYTTLENMSVVPPAECTTNVVQYFVMPASPMAPQPGQPLHYDTTTVLSPDVLYQDTTTVVSPDVLYQDTTTVVSPDVLYQDTTTLMVPNVMVQDTNPMAVGGQHPDVTRMDDTEILTLLGVGLPDSVLSTDVSAKLSGDIYLISEILGQPNHTINDSQSAHTINDSQPAHTINDSQPAHTINDSQHAHLFAADSPPPQLVDDVPWSRRRGASTRVVRLRRQAPPSLSPPALSLPALSLPALSLPALSPPAPSSKRRRPRKTKKYEMKEQDDPNEEQKRKNAINAKKNRESKKKEHETMRSNLEEVQRERDMLAAQLNELKHKEQMLSKRLLREKGVVMKCL